MTTIKRVLRFIREAGRFVQEAYTYKYSIERSAAYRVQFCRVTDAGDRA
jgi:hypothetical protein